MIKFAGNNKVHANSSSRFKKGVFLQFFTSFCGNCKCHLQRTKLTENSQSKNNHTLLNKQYMKFLYFIKFTVQQSTRRNTHKFQKTTGIIKKPNFFPNFNFFRHILTKKSHSVKKEVLSTTNVCSRMKAFNKVKGVPLSNLKVYRSKDARFRRTSITYVKKQYVNSTNFEKLSSVPQGQKIMIKKTSPLRLGKLFFSTENPKKPKLVWKKSRRF